MAALRHRRTKPNPISSVRRSSATTATCLLGLQRFSAGLGLILLAREDVVGALRSVSALGPSMDSCGAFILLEAAARTDMGYVEPDVVVNLCKVPSPGPSSACLSLDSTFRQILILACLRVAVLHVCLCSFFPLISFIIP